MNWINIEKDETLEELKNGSFNQPVIIYKHSTRCSISATTLFRLERGWNFDEIGDCKLYFLDLIRYRKISNEIADMFNVEHQSPQVLVIVNGSCIYHASHLSINYASINEAIKSSKFESQRL
ncbi:MAG TPA: bacillithiol system redox-active protein YtxJ [Cyclobacteriaceae bacterium]